MTNTTTEDLLQKPKWFVFGKLESLTHAHFYDHRVSIIYFYFFGFVCAFLYLMYFKALLFFFTLYLTR